MALAQVLWRAGDTSAEPRHNLVGTAALAEYEELLLASKGARTSQLPALTEGATSTSQPATAVADDDENDRGESDGALPLAAPLAEMLHATRLNFRHLSADVIGALESEYKSDATQTLSRVYSLLFALAEAGVGLLEDLTFSQRDSVMMELLVNGAAAAGRELRSLDLPGCAAASSLQIPDEEALLAAGSVPIYEVALDKHGKLVAGSHRIARHDRTVVHATLGPTNMLRVLLPEDDALSGAAPQSVGLAELGDTLAGGLVVCGRRFEFFGAKSDHKMSDIKVHFVAVATPAVPARALYTREPAPRAWRTPGEARSLLAAFETLPTVEKLSKRIELMFSSTVQALEDVAFSVQHCRGALTVLDCAGLPAGTEGRACVYVCDDLVGALPSGEVARDADGEPRLMSDGAGLISLDLARRIPAVVSGRRVSDAEHDASSAPLVTQLRLWLEGMLAKGTLCACGTLPSGVIVLRRGSMVKVDCGGATGSAEPAGGLEAVAPPSPHDSLPSARLRAGFCRFEVCETSERAASARLSASLIEILADGARRAGGPSGWEALARHLTELQEAEVRRVRKLLAGSDEVPLPTGSLGSAPNGGAPRHADGKRVRAAAIAELAAGADASNSLGVSASSMLLSGFDPVREPRLVELLRRLEEVRLTSLGSFKLPLLRAVSVFGQPDPTNSLPEGHVCVVVDGMELAYQMCTDTDGRGGGETREVLIHKSPGCHAGDVRKLKHTRTPELEALLRGVDGCRAHTVFFSTRGERAIADTIAGCDHDGDKFTVITDPLLVRLFAEAPPWDAPPRGRKAATTPDADPCTLQRQLISQVLKVRYKSSPLVGQSALSLMALADEAGLGDARVRKLIDVYYAALDVGVTGEVLTSLPSSLCPRMWPEWMRGRSKRTDITYRPSPPSSILGRLHGSLQQVLAEASARKSAPVICDPMLYLEGSERCVPPRLGVQCVPCAHSSGSAPVIHTPPRLCPSGFMLNGGSGTTSTAERWPC